MAAAGEATDRRRSGYSRWWRESALTVGAVVGSLCLVAAVAGAVFGVKPLVFRSGSMSPTIGTGALALSRTVPAADLRVGDVVSVEASSGVRVTHRIETVARDGDLASLILKGDANPTPDTDPYVVNSAERVFLDVPKAGYAVAWAAGPVGVFGAGLLVGLVLLIAFGPEPGRRERRKARHAAGHGRSNRGDGMRRASAVGAVLLLVGAGSAATRPSMTLAYFSDTATTTTGQFTAAVIPAPSLSCQADLLSEVRFTWTAVSNATSYTFHYGANGSQTADIPANEPRTYSVSGGSGTNGTAWVVTNRAFGAPVVTTWTSGNSNTFSYSIIQILFIVVGSCG